MAPIAITGANGHLGKKLIQRLCGSPLRALVRSTRAADQVRKIAGHDVDVRIVDYTNLAQMRDALAGCERVVHLVGIIKEGAAASYQQAHEASCEVLVEALRGSSVQQIVYLSIVGSTLEALNACLKSKGQAQQILRNGTIPAVVLKVPMVLGENDYATAALKKRASSRLALMFNANSMEQPIYAGDVIAAICAIFERVVGPATFDLGGPRSLTRRDLTVRAAAVLNNSVRVVSLPLALGMLVALGLERLANPPITRAMLGVLDHDDQIDNQPALTALGISLTPLEETLTRVFQTP
ncbi:MAG: NAD(P)H-binding protein [Proteobacteria bacterium]|nr:NAD(P)H-binding protein [Pseudomonadota bacterium]